MATASVISRRRLVWGLLPVVWIVAAIRSQDRNGVFGLYSPALFALLVLTTLAGLACAYLDGAGSLAERRCRQRRLMLAVVSSWLAIAALEIPAWVGWIDFRVVFGADSTGQFFNPRVRLDRELLAVHRPYDHFQGRVRGDLVHRLQLLTDHWYDVDVRYDRNGFRNPRDVERADILLLGDSFIEAAVTPFEQTVGERLAAQTGQTVLNLGHSGYGPQQQLHVLRRYGLPVRPKVVLWFFYEGNDLQNYAAYEAIMRDWEGWVRREHGPFQRSAIRNALLASARLTSRPVRDPQVAARRVARLRNLAEPAAQSITYMDYYLPPLDKEHRALASGVLDVLVRAHQECKAQSARLILVFVPTKWRAYRGLVDFAPDTDMATWELNDLPALLAGGSHAAGIPFVDLTEPLATATRQGRPAYLPDDAHWSSFGHQAASDALRQATEFRRPDGQQLLHHSDCGCRYPSDADLQLRHTLGIECLMSRAGNCCDNAAMERFFWSLTHE